ncbi:MAG: TIGR00296 family protein [Thermoprotei archaeon]|nr:MAG: TIGR00296 family protein [Thermoprotei archaeon]
MEVVERFKPYTLEEGEYLVKLARRAVKEYIKRGKLISPPLDAPEKLIKDTYGIFTTIEKYYGPGRLELRGCIGYPRGYVNVLTALLNSAVAAAIEDPRFPPLGVEELETVVFEVSILSPMELIKGISPRDYPKVIKVGIHGLMVESGPFSGLLLPQVPVDYLWDEEEFLSQTCMKAFLPPDAWLDERVKVYKFQAQIFHEVSPGGKVEERDLLMELESKRRKALH